MDDQAMSLIETKLAQITTTSAEDVAVERERLIREVLGTENADHVFVVRQPGRASCWVECLTSPNGVKYEIKHDNQCAYLVRESDHGGKAGPVQHTARKMRRGVMLHQDGWLHAVAAKREEWRQGVLEGRYDKSDEELEAMRQAKLQELWRNGGAS